MPHLKDGTPAKVGQLVHNNPPYPTSAETIGVIISITPNAESCNAQYIPVAYRLKDADVWIPYPAVPAPWCVTLKECSNLQDVEAPAVA